MYPPVSVIDIDADHLHGRSATASCGLTICVSSSGTATTEAAVRWVDESMFTLTERETDDPRFVTVPSVASALNVCLDRIASRPTTTQVLWEVLSSYSRHSDIRAGLLAESLAYSTLQAGPEFAKWLDEQGPRRRHTGGQVVAISRAGDSLSITFDRPAQHNAFSDLLRAGLLEGLSVAAADPSISEVCLTGNGPSFCSGGDLREFGLFADPVSSHIARVTHSPAASLARLASRLGRGLKARVHGAVLGSGMEMAAYCPSISSHPESVFGLPELELGLIPGAGGTVSVTNRIGRWRTAYLVVSGAHINAPTALRWGLIDVID